MTFNWLQFGVILFAAVGSLSYGYAAGAIGTTLAQPTFIRYFGLDGPKSTSYSSAIVVGFQCGGLFGALLVPYFCDKFGRKKVLYLTAGAIVVTGALQAGSISIAMFITVRTLGGFAVGGILTSVPIYQSEIAPAKLRGKLMAYHGVMLALGYVISSWFALAFFYVPDSNVSWRAPLGLQCLFPSILLVGLYWLPESPRWLISRGQNEAAREILDRLHRDPDAADPLEASHLEFQAIVDQFELEKALNTGWLSLVTERSFRKRSFLVIFTALAYSCCGGLTLVNYLPSLVSSLGYGSQQQLAISAGYVTFAPIGNICASFLLDRIGRKKMWYIGLSGTILCLIGETIVIARGTGTKAGQGFGIAFFYIHEVFYTTCVDSTTFVYCAEIWPTYMRAKGFSLAIAALFLGAIVWLGSAPTGFGNIHEYYYLANIISTASILLMIWLFWPETANIPLENMGLLFGDATVAERPEEKHEAPQHVEWTGTGKLNGTTL